MGTIYKISNDINDLVYIGQTVQTLQRRWTSHIADSKSKDTHLYRAMRKYGIDHFFIEAIELNVDPNDLNSREIYWINYYDSYKNGYNSTPGGSNIDIAAIAFPVYQYDYDGNYLASYESASSAERATGCLHQNILKNCKGILRYCGHFLWSFEKVDHLEIRQDKLHQPINQLDENHNLICVWPSVKEAAQSIGVEGTHISRACRTKYKCHGYYWEKA